jgi:uncharacterized protein YjbI with pentapeptide repeats
VKKLRLMLYALFLSLWTAWLATTSDSCLVLGRGCILPFLGRHIPSGALILLFPVFSSGLFLWILPGVPGPEPIRAKSNGIKKKARGAGKILSAGTIGLLSWAALPVLLAFNALRAVVKHDRVLSYAASLLAVAGTCVVFGAWLRKRLRRGPRPIVKKVIPAAGFGAVLALDLFIIFNLIPWSRNGLVPLDSPFQPLAEPLRLIFCAAPGVGQSGFLRASTAGKPEPADLRGIRLEGAQLDGQFLAGATLRRARLENSRMKSAILAGADLRFADLILARLDYADLRGADLSRCVCTGMRAISADLKNASLRGAYLHFLFLHYCDADGADFSDADLAGAGLFGSRFKGAVFHRAHLAGLLLHMVDFEDADLSGADLHGAEFWKSNLRGAIFEGADLTGATGLDADRLSAVRTLRNARLDPGLRDEIRKKYPALLDDSSGSRIGRPKEDS